jgi:glutaredoxin 3
MKIHVYTKSGCPNCVTAKALLKSRGLPFEENNMDEPALMAAFQRMYPEARQMPQITIDGQRVGGLAGLQVALKELGL